MSGTVRFWYERLLCGHIVGALEDGTILLCVLPFGHKCDCVNHCLRARYRRPA